MYIGRLFNDPSIFISKGIKDIHGKVHSERKGVREYPGLG